MRMGWFTAVALVFLLGCPNAFGQDALEDGRRLIRDGQFEAALNALLPAYAASPTAQLAFAIGRAYDASNEPKHAMRFYSAALNIKTRLQRLTTANKRLIRKRMRTLKKKNRVTLSMATLNVQSNAPRSHVFLDRKPVGMTPLTGLLIEPGAYTIRVQRDGYGDWTSQFTVGPAQSINLKAEMPSITAGVFVQTDPPGANASVPGGYHCVTPCLLSLGPGNYQMRLEKPGYHSVVQTVRRTSGAYQALPVIRLGRLGGDARVFLRGAAEGAVVIVDGRIAGKIPLSSGIKVTEGQHDITVQKPGYLVWQTTVDVQMGQQLTLQVELQPDSSGTTVYEAETMSPDAASIRMWSWISMGVGGALVLGGGGLIGHALYNKYKLTSASRMRINDPTYTGGSLYVLGMTQADATSLDSLSQAEWIAGMVSVGLGLAGVATGLVLYFLDDEMDGDAVTVSVKPVLWDSGTGAVTTVRF